MEENREKTVLEKKKRKTLDDVLGVNGLLICGIIGNFLTGGIIEPILLICGFGGFIHLIRRHKILTSKQKWIGWILAVLWILSFGIRGLHN